MAQNAKITVLSEAMRGKSFEITRETTSIGRREEMDIHIPDPSLSGHPADIIRAERDGNPVYVLRDNESTNGTCVNGETISERELADSDVVRFGSVEVMFSSGTGTGVRSSMTHTIDISQLGNATPPTSRVQKQNPFAESEARRNSMIRKGVIIASIVLGVICIVLAVYALIVTFNG
ncbi:MAG: FHA domain-containing protein [Victivallaceae bacterium]|nr:FHA domain-containing protein [Victivallaceae bacterium]